jgi:hypothetical protein
MSLLHFHAFGRHGSRCALSAKKTLLRWGRSGRRPMPRLRTRGGRLVEINQSCADALGHERAFDRGEFAGEPRDPAVAADGPGRLSTR